MRALASARHALFAVLLGACVTAQAAAGNEERRLKELRARIERLQAELAAAEKSSGEAAEELRESSRAVSEAHRALFELGQRRRAIEGELAAIGERARAAREAIERQEQLAAKLLRLQYRQGTPDRLRLALEGRDAAQVARHLAYYDYVQRARAEVITGLRARVAELEGLDEAARARRDELAANEAERAREARQLEKEKAAREAIATRLAREIARNRREIGRLKRDEARLARLVEEIARQLAAAEDEALRGRKVERVADASASEVPFPSLKGRLRLPVKGQLLNRYGDAREEASGPWKGLFIKSPTGETVRAVADGQVVYADWLRGFGNLLILDHGRGYMSLYAYNDGLLRKVGDKVRAGEAIASVGATGSAADSGLYFELRRAGKPFDPMSWVAQ